MWLLGGRERPAPCQPAEVTGGGVGLSDGPGPGRGRPPLLWPLELVGADPLDPPPIRLGGCSVSGRPAPFQKIGV